MRACQRTSGKDLLVVACKLRTAKCATKYIRNSHKSIEIEGFIRESCCAIFEKNKASQKWRREADKDSYHEKTA